MGIRQIVHFVRKKPNHLFQIAIVCSECKSTLFRVSKNLFGIELNISAIATSTIRQISKHNSIKQPLHYIDIFFYRNRYFGLALWLALGYHFVWISSHDRAYKTRHHRNTADSYLPIAQTGNVTDRSSLQSICMTVPSMFIDMVCANHFKRETITVYRPSQCSTQILISKFESPGDMTVVVRPPHLIDGSVLMTDDSGWMIWLSYRNNANACNVFPKIAQCTWSNYKD